MCLKPRGAVLEDLKVVEKEAQPLAGEGLFQWVPDGCARVVTRLAGAAGA